MTQRTSDGSTLVRGCGGGILRVGFLLAVAGLCLAGGGAQVEAQGNLVSAEPIANGFTEPVDISAPRDGTGRIFVSQRDGMVFIVDGALQAPQLFLDISSIVSCCAGEQGLLSLEFHPDYANNGFFYIYYTDDAGSTVLARYGVSADDPNLADPASAFVMLTVSQPTAFHNGGELQFGPDGFLYLSLGNGGEANPPSEPAQDLGVLLGKVIRIDVDGGTPYAIPPDNPFVGVPGAREEIWALGLRNPWRFGFDRETGDLFIADVGEGRREEVDFQSADSSGGENYGWRFMEGSLCFDPPVDCDDGTLALPILEYDHIDGNCSITGGYRYRGALSPQLDGIYIYGDFCSGVVWGAILQGDGTWTTIVLAETGVNWTSFGEDENGEIYAAGFNTGTIYRLSAAFPQCIIELSQSSYVNGETVTADVFSLSNLAPFALQVEIKTWFETPAASNLSVHNVGADGSLSLPEGQVRDLGPDPLLTIQAGQPRGTYQYNCRLLDPVTGTSMHLDNNIFEVQ